MIRIKNPAGGFNIYTLGDIIEMTYLSVLINGKVFRKNYIKVGKGCRKVNRHSGTATGILLSALVIAGGFYIWFSCIVSVALMIMILVEIFNQKKIVIIKNPFGIAVMVVGLFYLLSCLWAVDRGMALFGFFKFLPFPLYLIYLEQHEIDREKIIRLLPAAGTVITVLTYIMSRFKTFDLVVAEGRLSGSFLYPNTFAIFLLVCLLVAIGEIINKDYFEIIYAVILLFGIYKTGSRAVYIITVAALFAVLMISSIKPVKKIIICICGAGTVGVAAILFGGRLADISLKSSTFLGRLLYYKDGIRIILKHPFGLGYHGYYFVEKQYQTGVYNVLNIHNDVMQLFLDIGFIPALLFFAAYIYYIVRTIKQKNGLKAIVLTAILMHIVFDYDMQFIAILFIILLFIDDRRGVSNERVSILSLGIVTVVLMICITGALKLGSSDYLYTIHRYEKSYKLYNGNTMSEAYMLREITNPDELKKYSEDVVDKNKELYVGYLYLASSYLQSGDFLSYMNYTSIALEKAPYEYQNYVDYATVLIYAAQTYINDGDKESASICVGELNRITGELEKLKDSSDKLAWKIYDKPQTELPTEYQNLIYSLKEQLYE